MNKWSNKEGEDGGTNGGKNLSATFNKVALWSLLMRGRKEQI